MLDDVTKKKINTLRQILVGKLPDPKAQVEQITNGLIYKFMNDMDEQSVSMGGKSTYFSGKFQKYSWKNLMDTKTSGVEKIKLYSDAIEQMYTNENLPELFREIFKNSFLPFKDPSTLNMFLKEINEFHYSNSETLGDAFEYLLSFMGSQGDAGQFRTPRHIIDFITEIVNPQKNETVLDPACGTAGFLISAYKYILKQNTKKNLGDGLSASDRKKIGENLNGYDISPDMVKMSLVNMYLHKFTNPKINEYDTLSSEDRWNEYYDVILANPPFFSPKGGIMPHNRFGVSSTKAEVLFIDYINEHLKPNGRAGIIVPEGVIFQNGTAYKQLRKNLTNSSLMGIISLPAGVFQPYSGVKTSILILDKNKSKTFNDIFYIEVKNDGYSLNTNRNPISKNDLPELKIIISNFLEGKKIDKKLLVNKETILASEDLMVKAEIFEENQNTQLISMSEVIEVKNGYAFKSADMTEENKKGFLPVLKIGNVSKQGEIKDGFKYHKFNPEFENFLIPNNSIIIAMTGATVGKVAISTEQKLLLNQRVGRIEIKNKEKINNKYLFYLLKSEKFYHYCQTNAVGGAQGNISSEEIAKFMIPLPLIETQNQIVEELDSYQKVIDGCRQVVENYKPSIDIDPTWEKFDFDEVCQINKNKISENKIKLEKNYTYVDISSLNNKTNEIDFSNIIKGADLPSRARRIGNNDDVIFSSVRPNLKAIAYLNDIKENTLFSTGFMILTPKENLLSKFLYYSVCSEYFTTQLVNKMGRGSYPSVNQNDVASTKIYLPTKETQKIVVEEIDKISFVIKGNRDLILQMEEKISNSINKIWSN
ncbi:N-6 DNA methylase [Candidatus Pelagibacter sp. Uisw_134_02]|uniref:N-6 DNA methylase n=1 Tax=Candidatus Pelagibacter sp. Uisw_134_02 TaxID=3230990 RepID=UPI0039EC1516